MINTDLIMQAVREARQLNYACDRNSDQFAQLLDGRLRKVSPYYLKRLKRELSQFNARTQKWNN